jgi:hypothetical protein
VFWRRRREREDELDRELRSHLELEAEEQQEAGVPSEEAHYAARRAFGNVTLTKENTRAVWGWNCTETVSQDLRFAARGLRKSPGFTLTAVMILALGTGANTAIFSIVNAVLLRPLPFRDPHQVMLVWEKIPKRGIDRVNLCPANFLDLRERNRSFATVAAASVEGRVALGPRAGGARAPVRRPA